MIDKFNISIYFYDEKIYIFPMSETKNNEYYEEFPPLVLNDINSKDLGNMIISSISKIQTNIDQSPHLADDFAKTFGEKSWNSLVKKTQLILVTKEQGQVDEFYIVPTLKKRNAWEYDYDNEKIVNIHNIEEIGNTVISFLD